LSCGIALHFDPLEQQLVAADEFGPPAGAIAAQQAIRRYRHFPAALAAEYSHR
jgi:hypothetical protein